MNPSPRKYLSRPCGGFSILELLIATAVLALMVVLIAQLFSSASAVTTHGSKHMDADAQARAVLDRMAVDFGRMILRPDVDYFVKSPADTMAGNDQIAFYSEVPGYYPSDSTSPMSLVGYRINPATNQMERLGKGLLWNGESSAFIPMVHLPLTLKATWPAATNQDADDDYELSGPQVFRFEYGYVLKGRTSSLPSVPSAVPWDNRAGVEHASVGGFRDVSAIIVTIAVIEPKSRVLINDATVTGLAGKLLDFNPGSYPNPGDLESQWRDAIDNSALPRVVTSSLRIYGRTFPLNSATP